MKEHLKCNWCSWFTLPEFSINKVPEKCCNLLFARNLLDVLFNIQIWRILKLRFGVIDSGAKSAIGEKRKAWKSIDSLCINVLMEKLASPQWHKVREIEHSSSIENAAYVGSEGHAHLNGSDWNCEKVSNENVVFNFTEHHLFSRFSRF